MRTYVWPDAVCVWVEKLAGKLEILTKNGCYPSPPPPPLGISSLRRVPPETFWGSVKHFRGGSLKHF